MTNQINQLSEQGRIQKAARPHLSLKTSSLAQIEVRYADRTPNGETTTALSELPTRRFKTSAQVLRSLKA
jgi:hypothetical protein